MQYRSGHMYKLNIEFVDFILECIKLFSWRPTNLAMDNVDGNNIHVVGSSIANRWGLSNFPQEDSCTMPYENSMHTFWLESNIETLSECENLWSSSSNLLKQSKLLDGFEEINRQNLN